MTTAIRSREDFDKYLAAFNSNDFDAYSGYYASNAVMGLGNFVIRGRDDIMRFFRDSRQRISEHIDPVNVIITPGAVAVIAVITFTALVNLEEPFFDIGGPVPKGDGYQAPFVIFYELNERGEMENIACGRTAPAEVVRAQK